ASLRRDGSSRLGANNKYATFPSAAIAWNVAKEPFLQNAGAIDNLKVRASYGKTGNQGVPAYGTLSTLNIAGTAAISNGVGVAGVTQGNLANPNLMWETTSQYDLGFEIALFKARLTAEIDIYYKKTEDLLLNAETPFYTGYTSTIQNVGSLENRGVDISLNGVIIESDDFQFDATINFSTFKNKVTDLGIKSFIETKRLPAPANDANSQLIVGEPVGTFWGAMYEGIDSETGEA
ncbi:unnamed protein product, partial [Scytosiphon promiscuus]